jgi:hypothetical protein
MDSPDFCRAVEQVAEQHNSDLVERLRLSEERNASQQQQLESLKNECRTLRMSAAREQRDYGSALFDKVLGSATFANAMRDIIRTSNAMQSHRVYEELRGWIPAKFREGYKKAYYNPPAEARFLHAFSNLCKGGIEGLNPAVWQMACEETRPLRASEIRNFSEDIADLSVSVPIPSSKAPVGLAASEEKFREYCMEPGWYKFAPPKDLTPPVETEDRHDV